MDAEGNVFGSLKNEVARAGEMGQVEEDQLLQQVRESPRANSTSLVVGWEVGLVGYAGRRCYRRKRRSSASCDSNECMKRHQEELKTYLRQALD